MLHFPIQTHRRFPRCHLLTPFLAALLTSALLYSANRRAGPLRIQSTTRPLVTCKDATLAVQVLGSGGPVTNEGRASTGYIVWIDGRSRIMVDVGGGTFVRFREAGARVEDLEVLAISHLHPDHVSDLPALLWSDLISESPRSLRIIGPRGNSEFPDLSAFLDSLAGKDGAFRQLSPLQTQVMAVNTDGAGVSVYKNDDLELLALIVPHGNAPTLAFRLNKGKRSVVFGADQNGKEPAFAHFAEGADVLVMHLTISESAGCAGGGTSPLTDLHAPPSVVGRVAAAADVDTLVLSHLAGLEPDHSRAGNYSLLDLEANVSLVRRFYLGTVVPAADLLCIPVE